METKDLRVKYTTLLIVIVLAGLYLVSRTPAVEVYRDEWQKDGDVVSGTYSIVSWEKYEEDGLTNIYTMEIEIDGSADEYKFLNSSTEGYIETGKLSIDGNQCVFHNSRFFESGIMYYNNLRITSAKGILL